MGQANKRGTFEQRKQQAIERDRLLLLEQQTQLEHNVVNNRRSTKILASPSLVTTMLALTALPKEE